MSNSAQNSISEQEYMIKISRLVVEQLGGGDEETVAALLAKVTTLETKLATAENTIVELNNRLQQKANSSTVTALASRVTTAEQDLVDTSEQISQVDSKIKTTAQINSMIDAKIETFVTGTEMNLAMEGVGVHLDNIRARVTTTEQDIATLEPRVTKNEQDIAALQPAG